MSSVPHFVLRVCVLLKGTEEHRMHVAARSNTGGGMEESQGQCLR